MATLQRLFSNGTNACLRIMVFLFSFSSSERGAGLRQLVPAASDQQYFQRVHDIFMAETRAGNAGVAPRCSGSGKRKPHIRLNVVHRNTLDRLQSTCVHPIDKAEIPSFSAPGIALTWSRFVQLAPMGRPDRQATPHHARLLNQ